MKMDLLLILEHSDTTEDYWNILQLQRWKYLYHLQKIYKYWHDILGLVNLTILLIIKRSTSWNYNYKYHIRIDKSLIDGMEKL